MSLTRTAAFALNAALKHAEEHSTEQLRREAVNVGWEPKAVQNLQVHLDEGHAHASFEGSEDWEYGTLDRPPLAVARTFENHLDKHADPAFLNALAHHLRGVL